MLKAKIDPERERLRDAVIELSGFIKKHENGCDAEEWIEEMRRCKCCFFAIEDSLASLKSYEDARKVKP